MVTWPRILTTFILSALKQVKQAYVQGRRDPEVVLLLMNRWRPARSVQEVVAAWAAGEGVGQECGAGQCDTHGGIKP